MTPLEHNFHLWANSGICDICGNHTSVIADVFTMSYKCLPCLVKERLVWEDRERQKKRIPLNLKEFTEL
jgi:hypothetical protein